MPEAWDARSTPASFWRVADGNYDVMPLVGYNPGFPFYPYWQPQSTAGYGLGENAGCRWYIDAEAKFPKSIGDMNMPKTTNDAWPNRPTWSNGNHWLVMVGLTPEKMLPQGVGYWSPHLSTAPGAKVTVSLKMRGKDLVSGDKGSPSVWLEFANETGQNHRRAFLVGKDDEGKMHNADFTQGKYDWKEVKETFTAPEGAIRMALFFGLRPCKGEVDFDDINIRTADEGPAASEAEILGPRLPLARIRETLPVDLSKAANRALADDVDNDGKGGWTDQGSSADMREFKTGERRFGGVPFKIAEGPKSIVVLQSSARAKGDLPQKVAIPVGRKFDTLFFLHSGAWCNTDDKEFFRYVLHYADGKDVTLSVGPQNMRDWTAEPVARFKMEQDTFSTVAQTVKVPQFGHGSVYRMEWSAPVDRRGVEIKNIEFIGNGKCVPVLLGITGVMEW
jgi:hypothetical protein